MHLLLGYLVIINVIGVVVMGMDKYKAIHERFRVPEKILFLVSLLGGSVGTWGGMYLFRHKTRHWYFVVGMPIILISQLVLAGICYYHFQ